MGGNETTQKRNVTVLRRCVACGDEFEGYPQARYCSDQCRQSAYRRRQNGRLRKQARRRAREQELRARLATAETEARADIEQHGYRPHLVVDSVSTWRPGGVNCIITDPPYVTDDAVELHWELANFAVDVLPRHGALVVMTWQPLLARVIKAMSRAELVYRWTIAWTFASPERTPVLQPRVYDGWKPILVYHKHGWTDDTNYLRDTVVSESPDKRLHGWGQSTEGFRQLVRAFSRPGEMVCDPFLGGGTTGLAALAEARRFAGCDIDEQAVETTRKRLV